MSESQIPGFTGGHGPQPGLTIVAGSHELSPVGAEAGVVDRAVMTGKFLNRGAVDRDPGFDHAVGVRGDELSAPRVEAGKKRCTRTKDTNQFLARGALDDPGRTIAGGDQNPVVERVKLDRGNTGVTTRQAPDRFPGGETSTVSRSVVTR